MGSQDLGTWLGSPPFISHEVWPFGRGPTPRSLANLRSPWSLTTYESWDDPPRMWFTYWYIIETYSNMLIIVWYHYTITIDIVLLKLCYWYYLGYNIYNYIQFYWCAIQCYSLIDTFHIVQLILFLGHNIHTSSSIDTIDILLILCLKDFHLLVMSWNSILTHCVYNVHIQNNILYIHTRIKCVCKYTLCFSIYPHIFFT